MVDENYGDDNDDDYVGAAIVFFFALTVPGLWKETLLWTQFLPLASKDGFFRPRFASYSFRYWRDQLEWWLPEVNKQR